MPQIQFANSTSVREQILANIKTTLESISIANGYHNDVQRVLRYKIAAWQTIIFPTLMVVGVHVDKKAIEGGPSRMNATLYGAVMCCLNVDPVEDTETLHDLLTLDVEKALQVDVRRGGIARDTTIVGDDLQVVEAELPFAVSTLTFEVMFTYDRQDPTFPR